MTSRDDAKLSSLDEQIAPSGSPKETDSQPKTTQQAVLRISHAETRLQLAEYDQDAQDELLEASLGEYQLYLEQLSAAKDHLDSLLSKTSATLDLLSEITTSFSAVESQTSSFRKQTEDLIQAQQRDEIIAEKITENLKYYEPLDRITRRLNAPGAGNIVRSKGFSEMLVELDQCIDYMQTHQEQKEAETYRSRYRLLLTRALTLVRTQFLNAVRETSAEVARRIADKQLNDTTMSALLYAKFRVGAAELKELGLEIHKRANPPADAEPGTEGEYQSLMNELHTGFAASRGRLIIPLIRSKLVEIAQVPSTSKDAAVFARSSISYIRGMCLDEFELWGEWFHGQRGLYDLLESVCEPLYDHLRPRIIHEVKLSKLCQLCSLLQTRYMNEGEDEYEPPDLNELDFAQLIRPALEDTQSRIVFRAQAILRDDIENFKPKPKDVDYPAILRHHKTPTSGHKASRSTSSLPEDPDELLDSSISAQERFPLVNATMENKLATPYPTLPRAISLLSMIYRLLNPTIFDDLAHRIVHETTYSIIRASNLVRSQKNTLTSTNNSPSGNTIDQTAHGQLFLLAHLLLLKSQIVAFDIEYSPRPEMSFDFSNLTNTFYELQSSRGGLFNPLNLVRFVGKGRDLLPRVVENMLDAKEELDGCLRKIISEFVDWEAGKLIAPLKSIGRGGSKAVEEIRRVIEKEVPNLRGRMEEWIDDLRTRETLVTAVREAVSVGYEEFWTDNMGQKMKGGMKAKSKGKGREDEVWDIETFVSWTEAVFGVVAHEDIAGAIDGDDGALSRSLSRDGSNG